MNFFQTAITILTLAISLNGNSGVRAGNAGNLGGSGAEIAQNQINNNVGGSGALVTAPGIVETFSNNSNNTNNGVLAEAVTGGTGN